MLPHSSRAALSFVIIRRRMPQLASFRCCQYLRLVPIAENVDFPPSWNHVAFFRCLPSLNLTSTVNRTNLNLVKTPHHYIAMPLQIGSFIRAVNCETLTLQPFCSFPVNCLHLPRYLYTIMWRTETKMSPWPLVKMYVEKGQYTP
jgi:hypothetical protein